MWAEIVLNGATTIIKQYYDGSFGNTWYLNIVTLWYFTAADYVQLFLYSGLGANNIDVAAHSPEFWIYKVG